MMIEAGWYQPLPKVTIRIDKIPEAQKCLDRTGNSSCLYRLLTVGFRPCALTGDKLITD